MDNMEENIVKERNDNVEEENVNMEEGNDNIEYIYDDFRRNPFEVSDEVEEYEEPCHHSANSPFVRVTKPDPRVTEKTNEIREKLIKSGEIDHLSNHLKTQLLECGWHSEIKHILRVEIAKRKGKIMKVDEMYDFIKNRDKIEIAKRKEEIMKVDEMQDFIMTRGKNALQLVPANISYDALQRIRRSFEGIPEPKPASATVYAPGLSPGQYEKTLERKRLKEAEDKGLSQAGFPDKDMNPYENEDQFGLHQHESSHSSQPESLLSTSSESPQQNEPYLTPPQYQLGDSPPYSNHFHVFQPGSSHALQSGHPHAHYQSAPSKHSCPLPVNSFSGILDGGPSYPSTSSTSYTVKPDRKSLSASKKSKKYKDKSKKSKKKKKHALVDD